MSPWLLAARPKTLWAAVAPVMVGTAMAYAENLHHWPSAVICLVCAVLIQIATNFWNDYADFAKGADTTERLGPLRATQAGLVSPHAMRAAALFTFAAGVAGSGYLVWRAGWPIAAIAAASVIAGILYTGGPKPLGYAGWGDAFVLVFFGPVAVGGAFFAQTLRVTPEALVAGLAPGLLATAILVVNNLRDIETDARAGKRTLAVRLGAGFARWEYVFCIAVSAVIPILLHRALVACLVLPAAAWPLRAVFSRTGKALNPVLGQTALLMLLYAVLFAIGWTQ